MSKDIRVVALCETHDGPGRHYIRPADIPMNGIRSDSNTFGSVEVETTAGRLLSFFKSRGFWTSFTLDELREYYLNNGWDTNIMLYGLIGWYLESEKAIHVNLFVKPKEPLMVLLPDGTCCVTEYFVERCMRGSKKKAA